MRRVISEKKLPCGGTKLTFHGKPKPPPKSKRKRYGPISDKRHFAGVKAHDTKLRRQVAGLVGRTHRAILLKQWKPASNWLWHLAVWIDKQFGWTDGCKINGGP